MIGKTLGRYKILEQLGRGGMGEVYLAEDLSLDRKVALKFLPDVFTGDPERMARFEREAKLLASLNHPNIAAIYGLEQADGKRFLIMEYVEGETLQARIGKGALPVEEALGVCRQMADGLEAAHEKGVIHRDLKPANVMITGEEKVKILDFGLAKALLDEGQSVDSSQSPTITEAMTQPGVVLGTAAYMSPEQSKGKAVDKRADIWAFGCILYECLTGKRVFEGETVTETLAAILRGEPDWQKLPETVPSNIRTLLGRCLHKDPHQRIRDIGDARIELNTAVAISEEAPGLAGSNRPVGLSRPAVWIASLSILAALASISAAVYFAVRASNPPRLHEVNSTLLPKPAVLWDNYSLPALSPDGTLLVFPARDEQGVRSLWLRSLADSNSVRLSGTNWAEYPFWSPDSTHIGYFAYDELRIIEAKGGPARTLCSNLMQGLGASWGSSDVIVLAANSSLLRVSASEGECVPIKQESALTPMRPVFLPDGKRFLFFNQETTGMRPIFVGNLETGKSTEVIPSGSNPLFVPPHWLLYMERNRTIYATQFDPSSLQVFGDPALLLDGIAAPFGFAAYTAADNALVAMSNVEPSTYEMLTIDRSGQTIVSTEVRGGIWGGVALSANGQYLAHSGWGLWIHDVDSGVSTRVDAESSSGLQEAIRYPVWSPHGDSVAYVSTGSEPDINSTLRLYHTNEGTSEEILGKEWMGIHSPEWYPDGESLAAVLAGESGSSRSEIVSISIADREPQRLFTSPHDITELRLSPDGHWLAYVSGETGRPEVFVRRIPGQAGATQVSRAGGEQPRWRADGKALFYVALDSSIMQVEVQTSPRFASSIPKAVIDAGQNSLIELFAVSEDAQQFLVAETPQPSNYILILNWTSSLKQ